MSHVNHAGPQVWTALTLSRRHSLHQPEQTTYLESGLIQIHRLVYHRQTPGWSRMRLRKHEGMETNRTPLAGPLFNP
eukprot:2092952-Amphidinium_carterae.1